MPLRYERITAIHEFCWANPPSEQSYKIEELVMNRNRLVGPNHILGLITFVAASTVLYLRCPSRSGMATPTLASSPWLLGTASNETNRS
jgi:hypothetical protein